MAPVASSQEGMLWHELFAPGCQNLPGLARRYRGPLDVAALRRALDELVRRHAPLRTGFELRDGQLVQVVRPHRPLELLLRDLTSLPADQRTAEVGRTVAEAGRRPFDLVGDPLFVPTLLRLGEQEHVLIIRTHHTVFDDWSVGVYRRQLARLYEAYAARRPSPLPEVELEFAEFARRQHADLAGPAGARELAFWQRELAGAPLVTQLPVENPDRPEGTPQGSGEPVALVIDPDLQNRLRELARHERATMYMTTLAAFGVLVGRYAGQYDLVLATVVANRNQTATEGLIGCFTKKVPLRLRLEGDPTFAEALARTRAALLGALAHQDLPFEAVVQGALGAAAAAHGLAPHVALVFQGVTPRQELTLPGLDTTGLHVAERAERAHFAAADAPTLRPWGGGLYNGTFVILSVEETEAGLACTARGAFHAPAVREVLQRYATLLADIVAHADRPISELTLLEGAARLHRGPAPVLVDSLAAAFRATVSRDPAAAAVRTSTQVMTFGELDARVAEVAGGLRALGAGPGTRIATELGPSAELIVAVLAVWRIGAAWVGLDPADAPARRGWIARDASVEIRVAEGVVELTGVPAGRLADAAAAVCYGAGSSALGRGVVLDHRAILSLLAGLRDLHGNGRRVSLCPRPSDDAFLRRMVRVLDGDALRVADAPLGDDPAAAVGLVASREVGLVDCAAPELEALLDAGLEGALAEASPTVLVLGTREGLAPDLAHRLRTLPGARAHVVYGPPECAFAATAAAAGVRGVGRALAGLAARVLDPHGRAVPVRAIGELHIAGASLGRAHTGAAPAGRPVDVGGASLGRAHTGQPPASFVEHGGERLLATGQLARSLPDGTVELLGGDGRDLRGFRVDPARVRRALAGCPGLEDIAVGLERDEHGEPALVVRARAQGSPPTLAAVRAFLWERLPGYAWPARLVTVPEAARGEPPDGPILRALWGRERGLDEIDPDANYWQAFSFLGALSSASEAGLAVPGADVTRNRTVATLATALWAARARSSAGCGA